MPHTLRAVDRDDETLAALKMLAGFDDDIAKDATRTKNRLRSVLTQIGAVAKGAVAKFGRQEDLREIITAMGIFSGRHFPREIILWAVRWYCRYGVSYRDLEEMMTSARRAGRSHHDLPLGPEIRP